MYHVLLAVDENEERSGCVADAVTALPGAAEDVYVTVFHSFTENPTGASATQVSGVRRATDRLADAGVEYEVAESSGDPAREILDFADEADVDAIFVGGRKRSPAGKALFGSVSQAVILDSDRPVTIAGRPRGD